MSNAVDTVAQVALPVLGSLVGGPVGGAIGGAAGSAINGGSVGQDLLGAATGGIGAGLTGAGGALDLGPLSGINSSITGALSPLGSSIGDAVSSGFGDVGNFISNNVTGPLSQLFTGMSPSSGDSSGFSNFLNGVASNAQNSSPLTSSTIDPIASQAVQQEAAGATSPASSGGVLSSLFGPSQNTQFQNVLNGVQNNSVSQTTQQILAQNPGMDPQLAQELAQEQETVSPVTAATSGTGASNVAGTAAKTAGSPSTLQSILKLVGSLGPLAQALHPTTYPGTQTQTSIQNQLGQSAQQQQNNNTAFVNALNSPALNRNPLQPNIDYYTYGSRPEQAFYGNINPAIVFPNTNGTAATSTTPAQSSQPILFKKGGPVKLASGGLPNVRGLNSGPINPRGIRGGIQNPLIPGGSVVRLAAGGSPLAAANNNQQVPGGQTDNINAKLSPGEFVVPADVTSSLGDGDTNAGSKKLLAMMKNVRQHKAQKMGSGKLPPRAKSPLSYMAGVA